MMTDTHRQALRFIVIGVFSTALYFGLLMALQSVVPSIMILTAICYILSMIFNFFAQGLFTFQVQRLTSPQMRRFVVMHLSALLVNSTAMEIMVNSVDLHIIAAQILVSGCITVATFLLSRRWVYN